MATFTAPRGVKVQTSEDVARSVGYVPVREPKPKKAPAKKRPSSKSDDE